MIVPVILAGGRGARLWPASGSERRKPFLALNGSRSLFQDTLDRLRGGGAFAGAARRAFIVAAFDDVARVREEARAVGASVSVLAEPEGRDTAAAVAAAALAVARSHGEDAVLAISPADHGVGDEEAFREALGKAAAAGGALGLLGAAPDGPSERFGYALPGRKRANGSFAVDRFAEKPSAADARALITVGALWNMGIFIGAAGRFLAAFHAHAPDVLAAVADAFPEDAGFRKANEPDVIALKSGYARARSAPFDRAVMEWIADAHVTPVQCGWSDLGDWRSVYEHARETRDDAVDGNANVVRMAADAADVALDDVHGCFVDVDAPLRLSGLSDAAIILRGRDLLIASLDRAQEVRAVAAALEDGAGLHHDPGRRVALEDAADARVGVVGCDVAVRARSAGGFDVTTL